MSYWVYKLKDGRYYKLDSRGSHAQAMKPSTTDDVTTTNLSEATRFNSKPIFAAGMPDWPVLMYSMANGQWVEKLDNKELLQTMYDLLVSGAEPDPEFLLKLKELIDE